MDLSEIEAKADELAALMLTVQQVGDIPARLEGLVHLAQIKRVVDLRAQWNAGVSIREEDRVLRERELVAMEQVATAVPRPGICGWRPPEPTKPAVDRLHELVGYFITTRLELLQMMRVAETDGADLTAAENRARANAYYDAATKLNEILSEADSSGVDL